MREFQPSPAVSSKKARKKGAMILLSHDASKMFYLCVYILYYAFWQLFWAIFSVSKISSKFAVRTMVKTALYLVSVEHLAVFTMKYGQF